MTVNYYQEKIEIAAKCNYAIGGGFGKKRTLQELISFFENPAHKIKYKKAYAMLDKALRESKYCTSC